MGKISDPKDLVTKEYADTKQSAINTSGILKGNGAGTVSTAVPGTDYQTPLQMQQAELLGVDASPISGSQNLVRSGGVYSAIENAVANISEIISEKQDKPKLITSGTNITLADNTEYRLADVSTLTIAYPSGNFEAWLRITTAASGVITITLPTSSYIGDAPTFGNGETWELSIKDGVVVAGKAVSDT